MPLTLRTAQQYLSVWDECVVDRDVVGTRSANAKNTPRIEHRDTAGPKRERKMQHSRAALGIVPHGTGDKDVTDGNPAGKNLACGDTPAAGDAFSLARPRNPVRATAADEHEILSDDVPQERLDWHWVAPPAPHGRCRLMRVHRQGERGRTTIASENTQHLAEFAVLGAPATELRGDAGSQHAMLL